MPVDIGTVGIVTSGVIALALGVTAVRMGRKLGIVAGARRIPALGGLAVMVAWWGGALVSGALPSISALGLFLASVIIAIAGIRDSRRPLSPGMQFVFQTISALVAIAIAGVTVRYVTNPFTAGVIALDWWYLLGYAIPGTLLALLWIVTLMNVMNFLDGMDGLAAGVGSVAFLAIGIVSVLPHVHDTNTAILSFAAVAALAGFLFWNLPPAGLYLGTVGSWFLGFLLAVLSISGASKVATLAVVGAVPLLDAGTVILARLLRGQSPFRGDLTHLHHRLARRGLSPRMILLLYVFSSLVLGLAAVLLQTQVKLFVFAVFACLFVLLVLVGSRSVKSRIDRHTGAG